MRTFAIALRVVITAFLRLAFRLYFRSIRVQGLERFPRTGPVLLVANHPNSVIDPALLMTQLPRPLHFAAKHTLFQGPFGVVFEAFRAIPVVRAQDDRKAMARNARMFKRFETLLRDGHVGAIFPEGLSQDEPRMAPAKTGAARIALDAEAGAGFTGHVRIVPVGLQFEPRRRFRGDAFIRIGEPFTIEDFADRHAADPREATRALTERISSAIKRLAYHVEDPDRIPFIERLVDVYTRRARQTGIGAIRGRGVRGELKQKMAACLNHYATADPEAVAAVERDLKRYERLREAAGLDRRLLEQPVALLPGPLAPVQAAVEAVVGLAPAAFGLLTSGVPYWLTAVVADRVTARQQHRAGLSLAHILAGAVAFPLCYVLEAAWVSGQFSPTVSFWFSRLLVPLGLFAWVWTRRMRRLAVHVGGRVASWMKLEAVARVVQAQQELIARMDQMRERYRAEVLGLPPSVPATAP